MPDSSCSSISDTKPHDLHHDVSQQSATNQSLVEQLSAQDPLSQLPLTQLPTVQLHTQDSSITEPEYRKASSVTIDMPHVMERSMNSQFSTQSESSSNENIDNPYNPDFIPFSIPSAESIIQAEGVTLRKSKTSKPLLSSIEEFDPKQTSDWIKEQIKSKIESNPKFKQIHSYTKIDFFRPYFDVEPKQLQSRLVDAYKPSFPLLQQEIRLLFYSAFKWNYFQNYQFQKRVDGVLRAFKVRLYGV